MSSVVKMGQILALFYGVLANPLGATAADQDETTVPKQGDRDLETDSSGSDNDNVTTAKSGIYAITEEMQTVKDDEDLYVQSHLQHMPGEIPIQPHGVPGPPKRFTFTDTSFFYGTPTLEHDQLPSDYEYEKPRHSKHPREHEPPPAEERFSTDLKTNFQGGYFQEDNKTRKQKHITFKEETKPSPLPKEDLRELIRQAVKEKFALGKPDDIKFFDAAIVYDKRDYDKAEEMKLGMKQIIREELREELQIELFDSENFSQSMVLVVEDVVDRAFVILVYLSRNTDNSPIVNLFVEEAVGLTRLAQPGSAQFSDRQYVMRPVHSEPAERRHYKTPVGLITMNGIDWYDQYSSFTRNKIVEIMKSAIEKRKRRNKKDGSQPQSHGRSTRKPVDNIRSGQSAFIHGQRQTQSTDSSYNQTSTNSTVNHDRTTTPYSQNASDWSMAANQGSALPSYRSSSQMTDRTPDVGVSTSHTVYPDPQRPATYTPIATGHASFQQPGFFPENYVLPPKHNQPPIYGQQANAMRISQPEAPDYLLPVDKLLYYETAPEYVPGPDQHYHSHHYQRTQPRVEECADNVNPQPRDYQNVPGTYQSGQQFRQGHQRVFTNDTVGLSHGSGPMYNQQTRKAPTHTQFRARESGQHTPPHTLAADTLYPTHQPQRQMQVQPGGAWNITNRQQPAETYPLSHDAPYSTARTFDNEQVSDLSTNDVEIDTRPSILQNTNIENTRKSKRSRKKKSRQEDDSNSEEDSPFRPIRDMLRSSDGRAVNIIGGKITQIGNNNRVNMHKELVYRNEWESESDDNKNVLTAEKNNDSFQKDKKKNTTFSEKGSNETSSNIHENMDDVEPRKASTQNKDVNSYKEIPFHSNTSRTLTSTGKKQEGTKRSSESIERHEAYSSSPQSPTDNEAVSSDSELFGSGSGYSLPLDSITPRSSAQTSFKTLSSSSPSDSFVSSTSKESGFSGIVQKAYNMNINSNSSAKISNDSDVD